jgi:hypothetical protein
MINELEIIRKEVVIAYFNVMPRGFTQSFQEIGWIEPPLRHYSDVK